MSKLQHDLLDAMDDVAASPDGDFPTRFSAFVSRVEGMFRAEEATMEEIDFMGTQAHQEQHARVLGALHKINGSVMKGDLRPAREAIETLLPQWFAFHLATMDVAVAAAVETRTAGGAPASTPR